MGGGWLNGNAVSESVTINVSAILSKAGDWSDVQIEEVTLDAAEFVDRALPVDPVVDEPRFSSGSDRRLVAVRSLP
jgi:hypothetical protein